MKATVREPLTVEAIERAYQHEAHGRVTGDDGSSWADCPGWSGFGYLGERQMVVGFGPSDDAEYEVGRRIAAVAVPIVDRAIIARANVLGWSEHRLFEWLNSRDGRHFADAAAIQLRRHSPTEHGSGGRPVTEDGSQRAARPPCHRLLVALVVIGPDLGQFELRGLASLQRVLDLLILDDLLVEAQLLLFLDRHYLLSAHKELFPIPDAPRRLSAAERKVDEREKLKREWKPA